MNRTIWTFTEAGMPLVSRTVPPEDASEMVSNLVTLSKAHCYKVFDEQGELLYEGGAGESNEG